MIPVMLFGVLFAGKRYSVRDYICVALITAGIVTFNLGGEHKQVSQSVTYSTVTQSAVTQPIAACSPLHKLTAVTVQQHCCDCTMAVYAQRL
jgi:UAA transporter family